MPYAFVTTNMKPDVASSCDVICEGEAGPVIMTYLRATPGSSLGKGTKKYRVPKSPLEVLNLLEKKGYYLIASAANEKNFVWTLRVDEEKILVFNEGCDDLSISVDGRRDSRNFGNLPEDRDPRYLNMSIGTGYPNNMSRAYAN